MCLSILQLIFVQERLKTLKKKLNKEDSKSKEKEGDGDQEEKDQCEEVR